LLLKLSLKCRGPLQTYRSSGGQHDDQSHVIRRRIERLFYRRDVRTIQPNERLLAVRHTASPKEIETQERYNCDRKESGDDAFAFQLAFLSYLAKKFATRFAMICGNRIETTTTTAEDHRRMALRTFGRELHCLARQR
jgi:hypothetical protein